jgi:prevent-host-death family protein
MTTVVNMYEAKKNLSKLVDDVVRGNRSVIICKYGNPMVRIVPVEKNNVRPKLGFAKDYLDSIGFTVPDDFDNMMQDEIVALFEGGNQ